MISEMKEWELFLSAMANNRLGMMELRTGDTIVLHIAEAKIIAGEKVQVSVQVRDVKKSDSHFKGVIFGFVPAIVLEHKGLKIKDEVEFEEQHIISCCVES